MAYVNGTIKQDNGLFVANLMDLDDILVYKGIVEITIGDIRLGADKLTMNKNEITMSLGGSIFGTFDKKYVIGAECSIDGCDKPKLKLDLRRDVSYDGRVRVCNN